MTGPETSSSTSQVSLSAPVYYICLWRRRKLVVIKRIRIHNGRSMLHRRNQSDMGYQDEAHVPECQERH